MDEEIREIASLELRNAFWYDFSALVNRYVAAAEGLDDPLEIEMLLQERTSIFGRDESIEGDETVNIWTLDEDTYTTGHNTLAEALEFSNALEVHLQGRKIFEKRGGEWWSVEEEGK